MRTDPTEHTPAEHTRAEHTPAEHARTRTSRRWWLTRRLHIDLLRVCSAFGPRA